MKVPHHYAGIGVIEKIDHRAMAAGERKQRHTDPGPRR